MKADIKLYYIIPAIFFIILLVLILIIPNKKSAPTTVYTTPIPLPTKIDTLNEINKTTQPFESTVTVAPKYTGATYEKLPTDVADLSSQKNALRKKTPLSQPTFIIVFDFASDTFTVSLNEPKTTSRSAFDEWLKSNYPAIPIDRFTFK